MEPERVTPLIGLLNFMGMLATGNPYPDKQITTELDNITVDTALPKDTDIWETGIKRVNVEDKWIIVGQYTDEDAAKIGHEMWAGIMREYPDYPLKDIDLWSLGGE